MVKAKKCFISYSHKDKKMCEKFITHFHSISRLVDVEEWYDGEILPGKNIDGEISNKLEQADVIFLLL